jgi:acyl carrier protein
MPPPSAGTVTAVCLPERFCRGETDHTFRISAGQRALGWIAGNPRRPICGLTRPLGSGTVSGGGNMSQARLRQAFADALGIPAGTDFEALAYRSIPEWNSVAHMQLVAEIETAFDLMLETDEVIGMSSYQKAKEILAAHGINLES